MHASDAPAAGSRHDPARPQCGAGDAIAAVMLLAEGRNTTAEKQAEAEVARKNTELQHLLDRMTAAGGQVISGPVQVPGGSGIVHCVNPQGAALVMVAAQH